MIRDEVRVRRLKEAIQNGEYQPDAAQIADGIIRYYAKTVFLSDGDVEEALGEDKP